MSNEYIQLIERSDTEVDERNLLIKSENENSISGNEETEIETVIKPKPTRVYWVDYLRIFASVLVVYIHVSFVNVARGKVGEPIWDKIFLHNSLPRHCVPVFVMISGIFFLNPKKELSFKKLFQKNILHMVKSLFFWSIYYSVFDRFVINYRHIKFTYDLNLLKTVVYEIFIAPGHFWYVYFVIGLYIATPLYRCITKERIVAWYAVGISIILAQLMPTINNFTRDFFNFTIPVLPDFLNKLSIEYMGNYTVYYILGYLLYTHEFKNKKNVKLICIVGFVSQIITVILRYIECHKKNRESNDFGYYNTMFVSLTAIGTFLYFKFYVNEYIEPFMEMRWFKTLVLKLSECSFGVYLAHMTIYDLLHRYNFVPTTFDPLWWIPIYTVIVYVLTFLFIYLLRLIPILKQVT